MDPPTENAGDFDYLLGPATSDAGVPVPDPSRADAAGDELGSYLDGQALASSDPLPLAQPQSLAQASGPSQPQSQTGGPQSAASAGDASAAANTQTQSTAGAAAQAGRKRPLDDKKARDKKRILRNRELARVSNERRKGRIKAMETELEDTRKTVLNLEESIRSLEAENSDLKSLLESKSVSRL